MPAPEARLAELGIQLPAPNPAVANYVGAVTVGQIVFVSGHGPHENGDYSYRGKLGREGDVATGQRAARLTIVNLLASLKAEIGALDRVKRVVKLLVLVNSDPEFKELPFKNSAVAVGPGAIALIVTSRPRSSRARIS
jgi:enamine deaminase RidA (YjgF/YER057c/UK114 family)